MLLGQPYRISGRVAYGRQLGRTIGAPTANVLLKRKKLPLTGVYAVHVNTEDSEYTGVANIGVKPTISGTPEPSLEVHVFDFPAAGKNSDLYGKRIEVVFCKKIRDEQKFDGLDALKAAIESDMQEARKIFESESC